MKPIALKGYDSIFGANQPQYLFLPGYKHDDDLKCVSACWYMNWKERLKVLFTGKIYTTLATFGKPLTPQRISVDDPRLGGRHE